MEVLLGKIISTYGIKGELKVLSCTDFSASRYKKGNKVILVNTLTNEKIEMTIHSFFKNKNLDIISFENYLDINLVLKYVGYEILIEKPTKQVSKDTYYYADLLECKVVNKGIELGKVSEVIDSGKQYILRIKTDNKDILYPFVETFIESIDIDNKIININPIEGMI